MMDTPPEERVARAMTERAAVHIGAVKLPGAHWAYHDDSTHRWYVVGSADLAALCDYLDHHDPDIRRDAYSHWCAGTSAQEMPRSPPALPGCRCSSCVRGEGS